MRGESEGKEMKKKHRLEYRVAERRSAFLRRLGVREPPKPLTGTDTLLRYVRQISDTRHDLDDLKQRMERFLEKRPALQQEYRKFETLIGSHETTLAELRHWMVKAAIAREGANYVVKGHLTLIVDNGRAA